MSNGADSIEPLIFKAKNELCDVHLHTINKLVYASSITGDIYCWSYDKDNNETDVQRSISEPLWKCKYHKKSCRSIQVADDGQFLVSGGKDLQLHLLDLNQEKTLFSISKAHPLVSAYMNAFTPCLIFRHAINRVLWADQHLIASGDDEGMLRIWDKRQFSKHIFEFQEHEDFISDMDYFAPKKTLLSVGGDGYLTVMDLRKGKLIARSDNEEEDLLSVVIMKNGRKVVCGSGEGTLNIFSWGDWGDMSDRFPGHPSTVDSICKLDEETLLTGAGDGLIRAVSVHPNKFLGALGSHGDCPIERMSLSKDGSFLASCSHDDQIMLWDLNTSNSESKLSAEEDLKDDDDDFVATSEKDGNRKRKNLNSHMVRPLRNSFFDGLAASDEE